MKQTVLAILLATLFTVPLVQGQDQVKKRTPLLVSHISSANRAMLRKKDAPQHHFLGYVICRNIKCRRYIGWQKRQRSMRFKGYKKVKGKRTPIREGGRIDSVRTIVKPLPVKPPKADSVNYMKPPTVVAPVLRADSVITLNAVLFDFDSYTLGKSISATLDSLVSFVSARSRLEVRISGHTDNVGRESHNLRLSSKRAEAVAEYLIEKGVGQERVSFQGFGSSQPVLSNETEEGKRRNRRVEILIHEKR